MAKTQKVQSLAGREDVSPFDPTNSISRQTHPLYRGCYLMPTPSIVQLAQTVAFWLRKGVTGGTIVGESNYGKSKGIKYIRNVRRNLFGPGVAVACIPMAKLPNRKNVFWQYVANKCGFAAMRARPVELDMLNKSIAGLMRICEESRADRLVLFIDDAQYMTFEHYENLKPIYDALTGEHDKRVLVVSIGERSLTNVAEDIKRHGKTAVNRFLRASAVFDGVSAADELEEILSAYDTMLRFPLGSDTSFTESLLPHGYRAGFRLAKLAHRTAEMYKTLVDRHSDFDNLTLSMKTCTVFAQSLLDELADRDAPDLTVDDSDIDRALRLAIGILPAKSEEADE